MIIARSKKKYRNLNLQKYRQNKSFKYVYDGEGNILRKKRYEFKTCNLLNTINYEYNKDNVRTSKTINNEKTNYYLENKNIIFEQTSTNMIYYFRDSNSKLIDLSTIIIYIII